MAGRTVSRSLAKAILRKSRIPSRITVLHLDALLVPAPARSCPADSVSRIFQGRSTDPVWMRDSSRKWIFGMARSSRIHFATELLSVHLERHSVPFSAGFLSAGGFTIEDASGASDPEWRSLQEGLVRRDAERMTAAISDASREIGPEAWASLILRQDGLPYGLLLPNATGRSFPLASCLLSLLGREAFQDVDFLGATLLRRRHISFDSAISGRA